MLRTLRLVRLIRIVKVYKIVLERRHKKKLKEMLEEKRRKEVGLLPEKTKLTHLYAVNSRAESLRNL